MLLSPAIGIPLASAALWPHVEVVFTHGTFEPPGIGPIGSAGVGHYVALSIVDCDGLPDSGYMRAKVAQEKVITESGLTYTDLIIDSMTEDSTVRVPDALIQPVAADDVSAAVARAAEGQPHNGTVDVGGPRKISFEELAPTVLARRGDEKTIVVDPQATYFGTTLTTNSLVTAD